MYTDRKALAYILGVYFGDGWITTQTKKGRNYYTFGVASIDKEFIERAKLKMEIIIDRPIPEIKHWENNMYAFQISGAPFFKELKEETKNKQLLPKWLYELDPFSEEMTEFFRGVIDSEGCITRGKSAMYFSIVINVKGDWFIEFVSLLRKRFQTLPLIKRKDGIWNMEKPLYSFLQAHIPLTIARKRERIKEYLYRVRHRPLPSETIRWASLEYGKDEDIVRAA